MTVLDELTMLAELDDAECYRLLAAQSVGRVGMIADGRNGGTWDGNGLTSSLADPGGYTTLGVAEATEVLGIGSGDTALFGNETVDGTSVLVKYTYGGDANLSGSVDVDDYGQIDFNASTGGVLTGWYNGDFDYNGIQNVDDYGIIDFVVNIQGPPFPTGAGANTVTAIPEPGGIILVALGAILLRRRRVG